MGLLCHGYLLAVTFFWAIYSLFSLVRHRLSVFGVRAELLFWFLGIAATPIALTLGAGNKLILNLSSNLQNELKGNLMQSLRQIETRSQESNAISIAHCKDLVNSKDFKGMLEKISKERQNYSIASFTWDFFANQGVELSGFMLFGNNDVTISRFQPFIGDSTVETNVRAHKIGSEKFLYPHREAKPASSSKTFDSNVLVMDSLRRNSRFNQIPGEMVSFKLGEKHSERYFDYLETL